jgi:HrpA-like RNA helicase
MDVTTFSSSFPFAVSIHIPGRTFPVQILYTKEAQDDYIDSTVSTGLQIIEEGDEGGEKLLLAHIENQMAVLCHILAFICTRSCYKTFLSSYQGKRRFQTLRRC